MNNRHLDHNSYNFQQMLVFEGATDHGYVPRMHKSRETNHYADTNIS